jgi:phenylpropionate dioxygenase-like ring-hydroxylating dioxygenase large terminal subunit
MRDKNILNSEIVTETFIPKTDYLSPEFARLEAEHLWPRVWQIACREEEVPNVGDFVTYDVLDDSIVVVRSTDDTIKAFHNVCPHRGRILVEGHGQIKQFVCRFHGWQFGLDGENKLVVDKDDWKGCFKDADIRLGEVRVDTWGGWVWINMDPEGESLQEFLEPVIARCDKFEFDKLRYRWYKTVIMPTNWKVALEAFDEQYHLQQAHSQMLPYIEEYSRSMAYGRHGAFLISMEKTEDGLGTNYPLQRSSRLGGPPDGADYRKYVLDFVHEMHFELGAMVTPRTYEASQRLLTEVDASATQAEVLEAWGRFQREAADADGSGWPADLTPEYIQDSHVDWHLFPNSVYLHSSVDGVLWYRARPNGHDPDSCIFDIWSLQRYAEGAEPPLVREFYQDWRETEWGRILTQDFLNIPQVQRGMKSRGFKGSLTNPVQERAVSNFHHALHEFIESDPQFGGRAGGQVTPLRRSA